MVLVIKLWHDTAIEFLLEISKKAHEFDPFKEAGS